MPEYLRALRVDNDQEEAGPISFVASTSGVKRDGKDLDQDRWDLANYEANPVILWGHDFFGDRPPIGKALEVGVEDDRLMALIEFDSADPFAAEVERKYREGYLNAVSVSWEEHGEDADLRYELLDISAVPIPGDPDALIERVQAGRRSLTEWVMSEIDRFGEMTNPEYGIAIPSGFAEALVPVVLEILAERGLVFDKTEDTNEPTGELGVAAERLLEVASRLELIVESFDREGTDNGHEPPEPPEPDSRPDLETRAVITALAEISERLQEVTDR